MNYFVLIIHQVNNHGVSRRWFTESDVKHFRVVHNIIYNIRYTNKKYLINI